VGYCSGTRGEALLGSADRSHLDAFERIRLRVGIRVLPTVLICGQEEGERRMAPAHRLLLTRPNPDSGDY